MAKRWGAIAAAGALLGLAGAGYYWLLRRPLARVAGRLSIAGLQGEVEILRDRWGVPHIYAESIHDVMMAQGFVHAQDRLWQMDFERRLASGRLSEVMGQETVAVDRWIRTIGLRRVAEQEVGLLNAETRIVLESYAAGVNARIEQGRLPIEFSLLRYKPEPWTPADTLSWVKFMAWALSVNWESELLRQRLIEQLGPDRAAQLEPGCLDDVPRIVGDAERAALGGGPLSRAQAARPYAGPSALAGLGSNSWVLDGTRTASGSPMLANDMHLPLTAPSIWYENHLVAGDLNVTGISFPGIPAVIVGHNGHVAWGYTNGFVDVQDLFVEHLRQTEDCGVEYLFQGEWRAAEVISERIRVKDSDDVVEKVILTHHGPIINSLAPGLAGEEPLALRWTALEPDTAAESLLAMNRARNCTEFREAVRHWATPVQNMVYADVQGNIGYSLPGKIPVRAKGDGRVPVPGWTGEYEWTGYIPFEELPHRDGSGQGYIATANNRIVGDDYPYYLGDEFCASYRAQRITSLIEARPKADVEYMQQMQMDTVSVFARKIARHLAELETNDPELQAVVARMKGWDGDLNADSTAAVVHQVFFRRMIRRTLDGKLGALSVRYAGQGPTPLLAEGSTFGQRAEEWLEQVLTDPDSPWFDLGQAETRDDVMRMALCESVDFVKESLGPDPDNWTWGNLHTLVFGHPMGRVKPLSILLNRGPYPLSGDGNTLWATGGTLYKVSDEPIVGPPFRFIADLGDLRKSVGVLVPGQSGQPTSRHYGDQISDWYDGRYHPMLYDRKDVERELEAALRLVSGAKTERRPGINEKLSATLQRRRR